MGAEDLDAVERRLRNCVHLRLDGHLEHEHNEVGKVVPLLHNEVHAMSPRVTRHVTGAHVQKMAHSLSSGS